MFTWKIILSLHALTWCTQKSPGYCHTSVTPSSYAPQSGIHSDPHIYHLILGIQVGMHSFPIQICRRLIFKYVILALNFSGVSQVKFPSVLTHISPSGHAFLSSKHSLMSMQVTRKNLYPGAHSSLELSSMSHS